MTSLGAIFVLLLLLLCKGTSAVATSIPPLDEDEFLDLNLVHAAVTPWKFDTAFELAEIPEPSGMCYCPLTGTLFVVDDGAEDRAAGLHEIDLEGKYLRGITLGKDLEGVCYCGANELLYLCDEVDETVHIVEPKELKIQGSFQVSRIYGSDKEIMQAGGNGFEGIEWLDPKALPPHSRPKDALGHLALLNQDDPSMLLFVAVSKGNPGAVVQASGYSLLPQKNAGELHLNVQKHELWVVNSWMNTVDILDLHNSGGLAREWPAKRWEVMPGMAQEGLAFDPQGRMWIGQDVGGVVRYIRGS